MPAALRIRALGQSELSRVVPNGHLAAEFLDRAWAVTARHTMISMEGAEGSYLLETLTGFVGDRVGNQGFEHDLYVMAPCCEPRELAHHQPIVIILIAASDLALFASWPICRETQVEHGSDGARVLTLMEMARRHREEQARLAELREGGGGPSSSRRCTRSTWPWTAAPARPPRSPSRGGGTRTCSGRWGWSEEGLAIVSTPGASGVGMLITATVNLAGGRRRGICSGRGLVVGETSLGRGEPDYRAGSGESRTRIVRGDGSS